MTRCVALWVGCFCFVALAIFSANRARAQSFGVELHNTLMPASGAMGGASLARPQDLTSAINGNPATLTQFAGTQFLFGGAWVEPTFNIEQSAPIPLLGVEPYQARSNAQGSAAGNYGVTQDLSPLGLPATFGVGFITAAGGGADFRQKPESNGTNSASTVFEVILGTGFDVTDRFSLGAAAAIGSAFFDGPFVDIGGMCYDYGLRGILGASYEATDFTTLGFYYQTKQHFTFENAIQFDRLPNTPSFNVEMDMPENLGFGVANNRLLGGRLLLATDFLYKLWEDADLYSSAYVNQFVVQTGAQYTMGRAKLRIGYVWAEDPLNPSPGPNIGGVTPPGGFPAVRYTQALLAVTGQNRFSTGFGVSDVLLPGIDLDFFAGGMFEDTAHEGEFTSTSIESYWTGVGLTWVVGRGRATN